MAEEEITRVRKKRKHAKKMSKGKRIALIGAAVVVALLVIAAATAGIMYAMGAGHLHGQPSNAQTEGKTYDEGQTVEYNGHTYKYNEDIVSLCVIGYDVGAAAGNRSESNEADAVMVLAVDSQTGKITAIAIPRDSMVEVGEYMGPVFAGMDHMQICRAFTYGEDPAQGSQFVVDAVQRTLYNMPINYYLTMNMDAIGELANQVGGVSLTVLEDLPGTGMSAGDEVTLFGDNALKYVRNRTHATTDGSILRQQREVQFLQQFARQALNQAKGSGGAGVLVNLFSTASDYSVTNLGLPEFTYLAGVVASNGVSDIDVKQLEGSGQGEGVYVEYVLDKTSVYETVLSVYYKMMD